MSDFLDIKSTVTSDDTVTRVQYHSYNPYTTSFNKNDEIRITIQQQDLYVLPHDSFIYIEARIQKRVAADVRELPQVVNAYGSFLFDEIRYELNGFEIDRCKNVGITTLMKGLPSFISNDQHHLNIATWNAGDLKAKEGSFCMCLPLNQIFGFAEDYKKIIMNAKHELIIVRSRSDINCFIGAAHDLLDINVTKIQWRIKHVQVSDQSKLKLLKHVEKKESIPMAFRSWELFEYPALPTTDKHIWAVKATNNMHKPRYVILGLQVDRNNNILKDKSLFDHCNISDVKLYLNSECYPYENLNLNFDTDCYVPAYQMYLMFQESYYHGDITKTQRPIMSYIDFKNRDPLFVFDCSRQNESIKSSVVDIRIEMETRRNIPPNTSAYCLIIHDNIVSYNPYTSVVARTI